VWQLLARRSGSEALMLRDIRLSHVSVRTCELWRNGWFDQDAVWGGEWVGARNGCIRFRWWSSKGKGQKRNKTNTAAVALPAVTRLPCFSSGARHGRSRCS